MEGHGEVSANAKRFFEVVYVSVSKSLLSHCGPINKATRQHRTTGRAIFERRDVLPRCHSAINDCFAAFAVGLCKGPEIQPEVVNVQP